VTNDLDDTAPPPLVLPPIPPGLGDTSVGDLGRIALAPRQYRFSVGGDIIELDAVCFIGRKPSGPRVPSGAAPRLVRVPSATHEVSASHLEIRQLGATVVVTDLMSTNGSTVSVPGSDPILLLRGASMVVSPGTLIDIGDGNVVEILPFLRAGITPSPSRDVDQTLRKGPQ